MKSTTGDSLFVEAYYSKQVDDTIVSPTTIIQQHSSTFSSFTQHSDCDTNTGVITFVVRDGYSNFSLPLTCINDLWYHVESTESNKQKAKVNKISTAAMYELWHQCLGHTGTTIMQHMSNNALGIPKFKPNHFYWCHTCMGGKLTTKCQFKPTKASRNTTVQGQDDICDPATKGQPSLSWSLT